MPADPRWKDSPGGGAEELDDLPPFDPLEVRADTAEASGLGRSLLESAGIVAGGAFGSLAAFVAAAASSLPVNEAVIATPLVGLGVTVAGRLLGLRLGAFLLAMGLALSLIHLAVAELTLGDLTTLSAWRPTRVIQGSLLLSALVPVFLSRRG